MRNQVLTVCAGLVLILASGQLHAASVELSPLGDIPVGRAGIPHPSLEFRNVSSGPNDLFLNTVSGEADSARGLLSVFADAGGDLDPSRLSNDAAALARVSAIGTITGPASGPVQARFLYSFQAAADTLTGRTAAPAGGTASALFDVNAEVGTFFTDFQGGVPIDRFASARAGLQYGSEHSFVASPTGAVQSATPVAPNIRSTSVFRDDVGGNNVLNDGDIRISLSRVSDSVLEGVIEILFTARAGDRMIFSADMSAISSGAAGHIASLNGLNGGILALDLPDGFKFQSEDDPFLTDPITPPPAVVPLPPSIAMLVAGMAGMGMLRLRRKRAPGKAV